MKKGQSAIISNIVLTARNNVLSYSTKFFPHTMEIEIIIPITMLNLISRSVVSVNIPRLFI